MAVVSTMENPQASRRRADEVLGIESGPSRRGSTYWGRVTNCAREHLLGNVLHWHSLLPDDNLDMGLVYHMCLEAYYRWIQDYQLNHRVVVVPPAVKSEAERRAFEQLLPFGEEPGWQDMFSMLERMLIGYFERWNDLWEIVGVEVTIDTQLDGFEYSTRLDAVVVDHGGVGPLLRFIEHKSSWRLDNQVLEGYTLDLQVMGQIYTGIRRLDLDKYPPFVGSLVNVCAKPRKNSPGSLPQYDRRPVEPSKLNMKRFVESLRYYSALSVEIFPQMGYPQNFNACKRRFGKCEFFELCRARPDLDAEGLQQMDAAGETPPGFGKRHLQVVEDL